MYQEKSKQPAEKWNYSQSDKSFQSKILNKNLEIFRKLGHRSKRWFQHFQIRRKLFEALVIHLDELLLQNVWVRPDKNSRKSLPKLNL